MFKQRTNPPLSIYFILFLFSLIPFTGFTQKLEWSLKDTLDSYKRVTKMELMDTGSRLEVGRFASSLDFDLGKDTFMLTNNLTYWDYFMHKSTPEGNFLWAKKLDGLIIKDMKVDEMNNIYVLGTLSNDFKSLSTYADSLYGKEVLVKYNATGTQQWIYQIAKYYQFNKDNKVEMHGDTGRQKGDIVIMGTMAFDDNQYIVFDPRPGGKRIYPWQKRQDDIFLLKIKTTGNYEWVRLFQGTNESDRPKAIESDEHNNIYMVGESSYIDLNPSEGTEPGAGQFSRDYMGGKSFLVKLNDSGKFVWSRRIGIRDVSKIKKDHLGNLVLVGMGTTNLPGLANFGDGAIDSNSKVLFQIDSLRNSTIIKIDTNGNFQWAREFEAPKNGGVYTSDIDCDAYGNTYIGGNWQFDVNLNPGKIRLNPIIHPDNPKQYAAGGYVGKLDYKGNYDWMQIFYTNWIATVSNVREYNESITTRVISRDSSYFKDQGNTINLYNKEMIGYAMQFSQDSCTNFTLFIDSTSNLSCSKNGYASIIPNKGKTPYTYSWPANSSKDSFSSFTSAGLFKFIAQDNQGCVDSTEILINGPKSVAGFDLNTAMITTEFRKGFKSRIDVAILNNGCDSISGTFHLAVDTLLNFIDATITPDTIIKDSINGDTLFWNFDEINYDSSQIKIQINFLTNLISEIGDTVDISSQLFPIVGDTDSTNNTKTYRFPIVNAYDPNDKQIYPQGRCDEKYIDKNKPLTYKIRFQNTGNSKAINIVILDTLSELLDPKSMRVLAKSHNVLKTEVKQGNVIKFGFNNINLPDSFSNEPKSHGYVVYEIFAKSGVKDNAILHNHADIYFDFNPEVETNTVTNTFVNKLGSCSEIKSNTEIKSSEPAWIYPNPSTGNYTIQFNLPLKQRYIYLYNSLGKKIDTISCKKSIQTFNISSPNGLYYIRVIENQKTIATSKLIKSN